MTQLRLTTQTFLKQISYYIRGTEGSVCLVKIYPSGDSFIDAHIATAEAEEMGILPAGHCVCYEVVEQDEQFYNRLITQKEAESILGTTVANMVR